MSVEQAEKFLIRWLRDPSVRKSQYASYGYDVYLPNVMRDFLVQQGHDVHQAEGQLRTVSSDF